VKGLSGMRRIDEQALLVDDNYLGRSTTTILAGDLSTGMGLRVARVALFESRECGDARHTHQPDTGGQVHGTSKAVRAGGGSGEGWHQRALGAAHRTRGWFAIAAGDAAVANSS